MGRLRWGHYNTTMERHQIPKVFISHYKKLKTGNIAIEDKLVRWWSHLAELEISREQFNGDGYLPISLNMIQIHITQTGKVPILTDMTAVIVCHVL